MTDSSEAHVTTASREVLAPAGLVFELIADPARQPEWDGNDNLAHAEPGQRVHGTGEMFATTLRNGQVRENHVTEFEEGRLLAWCPATPGEQPAGHLWRWEVEPSEAGCLVTHTYDWSGLHDENRVERARWTTAERLQASLDRLAAVAQSDADR